MKFGIIQDRYLITIKCKNPLCNGTFKIKKSLHKKGSWLKKYCSVCTKSRIYQDLEHRKYMLTLKDYTKK